MPMLDLPIEKLQQYMGSGICPSDFNQYWNEQLTQVDCMTLDYQLEKKEFFNGRAHYYDLFFKGVDGATIHAKYLCPSEGENIPIVLVFHDYKQGSKSWHHLTRYIGLGYAVLAMDCRGQGGMSEDIGGVIGSTVCGHLMIGVDDELDRMYYRKVYLDAYVLSKIAAALPQIDPLQIITYGQGQGGALAIVAAALNQDIIKCCAKDPFLCDFKRVWEMDLDVNFYEGLRYYFRWFDPLHERESEIFMKLGYLDIVNFAPNLKCQFLLATGLLDTVTPPSTQYAVFNRMKGLKKHLVFAKFGHELVNRFEDEFLNFIHKEGGIL